MSEFPIRYRFLKSSKMSKAQQAADLDWWFRHWIANPGENIAGSLKSLRCKCECADADAYVKRTVASVTAGWSQEEKDRFHAEMHEAEWSKL